MSDFTNVSDDVLKKTFQDMVSDREILVNVDIKKEDARSHLAKLMNCTEKDLTGSLDDLKEGLLTAMDSMLENFSKEMNKRTLAKMYKN